MMKPMIVAKASREAMTRNGSPSFSNAQEAFSLVRVTSNHLERPLSMDPSWAYAGSQPATDTSVSATQRLRVSVCRVETYGCAK